MVINNIFSSFYSLLNNKKSSYDVIFFSILLILIPIALITGPAIPDIFLSLIAFYFLVKSLIYKLWSYYKNPIVIGFLIFSFYGILRSLFSEMTVASLTNEGSVFYFRYIFFSMGVWYLLDKNPYISKFLIYVCLMCLSVVIVDGFYQYIFDVNFFGNSKYNDQRLTGLFGNEPIIGRYVSYLSIFTFALVYKSFKESIKTFLILFFFIINCGILIFLSGERAPFFNFILFIILVFIFNPSKYLLKLPFIALMFLLIFTALNFNSTAKLRMFDSTIEQISSNKFSYLPYSSHHERYYITSLKMFYDKPIFGIGTNLFSYQCNKKEYFTQSGCGSHPHNYYLQLLAELGLFGFLFLLIFFSYFFLIGLRQLFFKYKSNSRNLIKFDLLLFPMIIFIYWWPIIPHMNFYNNWNNVFMMLPLGFFMKYFYSNSNYGNNL